MAKMFELGLKELFVLSFILWLVGYGIIGIIMSEYELVSDNAEHDSVIAAKLAYMKPFL